MSTLTIIFTLLITVVIVLIPIMLGISQLLGWIFESKIDPPEDIFNELYLDLSELYEYYQSQDDCKEQKRVVNKIWDNFLYLKELESKNSKKLDKNATKA